MRCDGEDYEGVDGTQQVEKDIYDLNMTATSCGFHCQWQKKHARPQFQKKKSV